MIVVVELDTLLKHAKTISSTGDRYNKIVKHYSLSREINSVITPLFHCRKGHLIRGELPVLFYPQVKRILLF
jgi:hypothetical protein